MGKTKTLPCILLFFGLLLFMVQETWGAPPEPISPPDQANVTDFALSFYSEKGDQVEQLEYQVGRTPDLSDPEHTWIGEGPVWLPDQPLETGDWYWRVRGVKKKGKTGWSEAKQFSVNRKHIREEPQYQPTPEHPLFLFEAWKPAQWASVPDDLKPYVAFKLRPVFYDYRLRKNTNDWIDKLTEYEQKEIPVFLLAHQDQYPSAELEMLYRRFDCVKGVVLRELMWWQSWHGFRGTGSVSDIITRHLKLAAKYGRNVIWTDGHWRHLLFLETGVEQEYLEQVIATYAGHFLPVIKQNFAYHPTLIQSLLQGFWLTDYVQAWGHQPESWYHHGGGPGSRWRGPRESCPPMFYPVMTLSGVRAGATVFSFEPPGDIWAGRGGLDADADSNRKEGFSRTWERIMMPLIREIIERKLIPTRQEVRTKSPVAVTYDQSVFADEDGHIGDYTSARKSGPTYRHAWKRVNRPLSTAQSWRHEAEVIPQNARYEFLPYIPRFAPQQKQFERVLSLEQVNASTDDAFLKQLGELYDPVSWTGTAYVQRVGSVQFIINNREQRVTDRQTFQVTFDEGPIRRIEGNVGRHAFVLVQKNGWSDRIYAQARVKEHGAKPVAEAKQGSVRMDVLNETYDLMPLTITLASDDVSVHLETKKHVVTQNRGGNHVTFLLKFHDGPAILTVKQTK